MKVRWLERQKWLKNKKVTETLKWIVCLVIIALIFCGSYKVWQHFFNKKNTPKALLTQVEKNSDASAQTALSQHDYDSYQAVEGLMARNYLNNHDLNDAERIMNSVLSKVPKNKISYMTDFTMVLIEQTRNDVAKEKYYYQQLINLLQSQGDTEGARQIQQEMAALK